MNTKLLLKFGIENLNNYGGIYDMDWLISGFLVILAFIVFSCTVYEGDISSVKGKKKLIGFSITSFFAGILFSLIYLVFSGHGFKDGYKHGQIDAIKGKIEYGVKMDSVWYKYNPRI